MKRATKAALIQTLLLTATALFMMAFFVTAFRSYDLKESARIMFSTGGMSR